MLKKNKSLVVPLKNESVFKHKIFKTKNEIIDILDEYFSMFYYLEDNSNSTSIVITDDVGEEEPLVTLEFTEDGELYDIKLHNQDSGDDILEGLLSHDYENIVEPSLITKKILDDIIVKAFNFKYYNIEDGYLAIKILKLINECNKSGETDITSDIDISKSGCEFDPDNFFSIFKYVFKHKPSPKVYEKHDVSSERELLMTLDAAARYMDSLEEEETPESVKDDIEILEIIKEIKALAGSDSSQDLAIITRCNYLIDKLLKEKKTK